MRSRGLEFSVLGPLLEEEGTTQKIERIARESQGQNLALTVLYVPYSLDSRRVEE